MTNKSKEIEYIELFHDCGLYIPTRTIKLDLESDNVDDDIGISNKTASKFAKNLMVLNTLNSEPITIVMNCGGGNVDDGYAIYDLIQASTSAVTIQVIGQASSMAMIILQAAAVRQAYPFSRFMCHDGILGVDGNTRDVEAMVEFNKLDRYRTYKIFENRTGKKASYWNRKLQKDYFLTAEQALEEGLIDEIIGVEI